MSEGPGADILLDTGRNIPRKEDRLCEFDIDQRAFVKIVSELAKSTFPGELEKGGISRQGAVVYEGKERGAGDAGFSDALVQILGVEQKLICELCVPRGVQASAS